MLKTIRTNENVKKLKTLRPSRDLNPGPSAPKCGNHNPPPLSHRTYENDLADRIGQYNVYSSLRISKIVINSTYSFFDSARTFGLLLPARRRPSATVTHLRITKLERSNVPEFGCCCQSPRSPCPSLQSNHSG